jgi:hypothetical protein
LAFFAPELQVVIPSGRQPRGLTLARPLADGFPIAWQAQVWHFRRPRRDV